MFEVSDLSRLLRFAEFQLNFPIISQAFIMSEFI